MLLTIIACWRISLQSWFFAINKISNSAEKHHKLKLR
jgi:hypothetical protein